MIDRAKLFAGLRSGPFPGVMTSGQVDGVNAILDEWDRRKLTDLRWLAYMLATTFHETGARMQPIIETTNARDVEPVSVDRAIARLNAAHRAGKMPWVKTVYWLKDKLGKSWLGRGLPQVTHETNYKRAEKETGIPFSQNPDLMLVMANAVPVMFSGMIKGWFTGHKLADYFSGVKDDPINARRIINSTESAAKVAGYHKAILADLQAADVATATAPVALPMPTAAPADKQDVKELSWMGGVGAVLAGGWHAITGSGLIRAGLAVVVAGLLYWFIARPLLRRMDALQGLYDPETGLLARARVAVKGIKTILVSRLLWIAGGALPLLSIVADADLSSYLPAITIPGTAVVVTGAQYQWAVLGGIGWIMRTLRKATNTAEGQTDLALAQPQAESPSIAPVVEDGQSVDWSTVEVAEKPAAKRKHTTRRKRARA